jgi:hypothetical protein
MIYFLNLVNDNGLGRLGLKDLAQPCRPLAQREEQVVIEEINPDSVRKLPPQERGFPGFPWVPQKRGAVVRQANGLNPF